MSEISVTSLRVHPLKSGAIRPVPQAHLGPAGLDGDRRWMVVDDDGVLVSARTCHELFRVVADTPQTDPALQSDLRLRAPGHDDLTIDLLPGDSPEIPVVLHRNHLTGARVSQAADEWLDSVTGRTDLHLVQCLDPTRRPLNPDFSREGDHTAYADGYPITIASLRSLTRLRDWITQTALERGEEPGPPLPIDRFRPNIVIDGDLEPFAEDHWTGVQIGEVRLRVAKPTSRCVMTTVDIATLQTAPEPIRTLARHRRGDSGVLFAVHLIPDTTGTLTVGDEVAPLS